MKRPVVTIPISNRHVKSCGNAPDLAGDDATYIGYFEDQNGEQWAVAIDRERCEGLLYRGDAGWDNPVVVAVDCPIAAFCNDVVTSWLQACWKAATGGNIDVVGPALIPRHAQGFVAPNATELVSKLFEQVHALAWDANVSENVILLGPGKCPIVFGKQKPLLSAAQFNVVKALQAAGAAGLNKDELDSKSGHNDARGVLRRLADSDPDWAQVIHFPGRPGRGYRIK